MKTPFQLSITEPCHENWQQMTPEERGRFCSVCQKKVTDFTNSTDRTIIDAFEKDNNLCGRFLTSQLDRDLAIPKEKKSIWLASIFFSMLSFSSYKSFGQTKAETVQVPQKNYLLGKPALPLKPADSVKTNLKTITGTVSDISGPLPGVNVVIKGTQIGVQTQFDGTYVIKAKEGDILEFSFMGMNTVSKTVNDANIIDAILKDYPMVTMGAVSYTKRKSFVGRQIQKIGNLFR